jgi:transcriptional regulator GlxA family with amidase domain
VLVAREYTATTYYNNGKTAAKIYSDAILDSIRYVDENFTMDLKIEDMTRKFLLSRTYFCDLFKKFAGMTFNEYISLLRINHAKRLLGTTDMSITEVAIASGFNDISNLCRQFARQMNVSPSEYRKRVTR